jgi:hypothetical protein
MTDQLEREAENAFEKWWGGPSKVGEYPERGAFIAGFKAARATEPRPELEPSDAQLLQVVIDGLHVMVTEEERAAAMQALSELARRLGGK